MTCPYQLPSLYRLTLQRLHARRVTLHANPFRTELLWKQYKHHKKVNDTRLSNNEATYFNVGIIIFI